MSKDKSNYHHGNLREKLLTSATNIVRQRGVGALSLRKLADETGVSRAAPYHHFENKNELLCAIAIDGFNHWHKLAMELFEREDNNEFELCKKYIRSYLTYANDNQEMYELMFGRAIWQQGEATKDLKDVAYPSFQVQVKLTKRWQDLGLMDQTQDTVRLAQITWATLHGIARLLIDGIYGDDANLEEMCNSTVSLFFKHSPD